jgi:hypothetical protein
LRIFCNVQFLTINDYEVYYMIWCILFYQQYNIIIQVNHWAQSNFTSELDTTF